MLKKREEIGGGGGLERIRTDCRWLEGKKKFFFKGFCGEIFLLARLACIFVSRDEICCDFKQKLTLGLSDKDLTTKRTGSILWVIIQEWVPESKLVYKAKYFTCVLLEMGF